MDQKFKDIHRNMAKTSKIEQSEDGRRPFEAHRERHRQGHRERETLRDRDSEKCHYFHAVMTETLPNCDAKPSIINNTTSEREREFFFQGSHISRIMFSDRFSHHPDQKILLRPEIR